VNPRLTDRGLAFLVASVAAFVASAALGAPAATAASGIALVVLATTYVATMPISRRLRAQTIELAWWVDSEAGARRERVIAKSPFGLRIFVRHQGENPIAVDRLEVIASGVSCIDAESARRFTIPPRARVDFGIRCVCAAPGRAVLHGAKLEIEGPLRFFTTRLYFPNRLRLRATPERATISASSKTPADSRVVPRASASKRRDEGTDLHELRELRPGDPYRRIAWTTSARLGKLIVRELERDELGTVEVVLDAGPSMRDGIPGARRLDRAIALAFGIAEDALRRGERVGVVTADRRVLDRVDADSRPDQRERLLDALLASTSCVDADRTVDDDAAVGRAVARYVRFQEGIEFADPSAADGVHLERLSMHVAGRARRFHAVHADTQTAKILRRFADHVGIPLQHRTDRDVATRTSAMIAALRRIAPHRRAPSRVVVLTDGSDLDLSGRLRAVLMQLRRFGHVVDVVLVGRPVPFETLRDGASTVVSTFVEDDLVRLRSVAGTLRSLGIGVRIDAPRAKRRAAA